MSNPSRFWRRFVGGFAVTFAVIDIACAIGPANGDTACEVLGNALNTPKKRAAFLGVWAAVAVAGPPHILKKRS